MGVADGDQLSVEAEGTKAGEVHMASRVLQAPRPGERKCCTFYPPKLSAVHSPKPTYKACKTSDNCRKMQTLF